MQIHAGLEPYSYLVLYWLCEKNNWTPSQGIVEFVRESRSFQNVLSDLINGRLDHSAVSGVVHNRRGIRGRKQTVLTVSGFEKSEIIAISHFALLNEITISHAVEKLLYESTTFMRIYDSRTLNEVSDMASLPPTSS